MQDQYDKNLYELLLGTALTQAPAANDVRDIPFVWDAGDGDGPDRLFNRYRRLRLQALAENAA